MNSNRLFLVCISILAALIFWGGHQLGKYKPVQSPMESESFYNYIIPRIQNFIPRFSLIGRRFVDRKIKNTRLPGPPGQSTTIAKAPPIKDSPKPSPSPSPSPIPKAQAAASPVPVPVAPTDNLADKNIAKQPEGNDGINPDDVLSFGGTGGPAIAIPPKKEIKPESQVDEWKTKIAQSPTRETMNEFILEFQTGRIKQEEYYLVLKDMIKSPSTDYQFLSVYALAATTSADSLALLLENRSFLTGEASELAQNSINDYAKPEHMNILNVTLKNQDSTVVLGTMPLILKIGSKMTLWTADYSSESAGRDRRGPTNRVPKSGLTEIIETLNNLSKSTDQLIAQSAHDTLSQISNESATARRSE